MAGDKREVRVAVVGDADQLARELKKAEGKLAGFGDNAKSAGDTLRTALFGGAVLYGAKQLVDAAANLEQAIGGTAAVFEDASGPINEFAKNAAEVAGLSEEAARSLTSRLGASLKGFGLNAQEAAEQSVFLAQTGADLAATLGGTTDEAVTALGAALRGEFDPLERFGIALKASDVNAKAVAMGLADSEASVSAYAKGQAALALITEKSAFAQGQFAREADTAAGQAQIAQAKTKNASADLGKTLLPIYTKIQEVVALVATAFSALPGPVQTGLIGLTAVALVGPKLVEGFTLAASAVKQAGTAILEMGTRAVSTQGAIASMNATTAATSTAAGSATLSMGPLIAVMVVGAAVYKTFSDSQAEAARRAALNKSRTEAFTEAIKDNTKSFEENIRSVIAQDFATQESFKSLPTVDFEKLAEAVTNSTEELDQLVKVADESRDGGSKLLATLRDLGDGGNSLAASLRLAIDELLMSGQAAGYSSESLENLVRDLDGLRDSLGSATTEQQFATTVVDKLGASFAGQATEAEKVADNIKKVADAARAAVDPYFNLYDSVLKTQDAQTEYNKAVQQYGEKSPQAIAAARQLAEAGFNYLGALSELGEAQANGTASAAKLQQQFDLLRAAGVDPSSAAMVELKRKIDEVAGAVIYVGNLDPVVRIRLDAYQAIVAIGDVNERIRKMKEFAYSPGSYNFEGRWAGGTVNQGTPYVVGEKGPELFIPSSYGRIMDAFSTGKAMLNNIGGGMGGTTTSSININVTVAPTADKAAIGQTIVEAISSYERRSGSGWRA